MADEGIKIRREYIEASLRNEDLLGRKQLRRLGYPALGSILAMTGVERIPDEYWALDVDEDGYSVAIVSCPCGITPRIAAGLVIVPCEDLEDREEPERCQRAYSFTGSAVFVFNSPKRSEA